MQPKRKSNAVRVRPGKEKKDLKHVFDQLTNLKYYMIPEGQHRHLNFGSVYLVEHPCFAQLLRYYVFSTTTGADHIFCFRTTENKTK